jgi:MoaA/NifB/PqqE/SkfB family radical SAM enzyme
VKPLQYRTVAAAVSNFFRNRGELKFAFIQVTTRCNARCTDRCSIWASKPYDVPLDDVKFAIDVLAENGFSVLYLTGGETGLYPHLIEAVDYAKTKGMITSLTSNGSISTATLKGLSRSLDFLSISIDNYDFQRWDEAKHVTGISGVAQKTVETAKGFGMKLYGITFLNPTWTANDVERVIRFVNEQLGISFAMSYPYVSSNGGTFTVGGNLRKPSKAQAERQRHVRDMVAKVLQMKLEGSDVATVSGYMRDVLRAHEGAPMKYPCNAGRSVLTIDCNLDVYPCYRRGKLFNLRHRQDLNLPQPDNSECDCTGCLINCFKEASLASGRSALRAIPEEFFSNPKFYLKILTT